MFDIRNLTVMSVIVGDSSDMFPVCFLAVSFGLFPGEFLLYEIITMMPKEFPVDRTDICTSSPKNCIHQKFHNIPGAKKVPFSKHTKDNRNKDIECRNKDKDKV